MNIIFGREQALALTERYIVLELDTIKFGNDKEVTAFCVVENFPINEMGKVENMKNLHNNLIENYRKRDWNFCVQALEHLKGYWNRELDSFYVDLEERIATQKNTELVEEWDWKISR